MSTQLSAQLHRPVHVALEPVSNALNSFSLLNEVGRLSGLNTWVVQTSAELTHEQRHTNQMVFAGLRDALLPTRDEPDIPAYLRHLAELEPSLLTQRVLEALCYRVSHLVPSAIPDTKRLLEDEQFYLSCVQQLLGEMHFNRELQAEVHKLLQDPPVLRQVVLSHIELLWQTTFAVEWKRVHASLRTQVEMFKRGLDEEATPGEIFRSFTGRQLPAELLEIAVDTLEVILIPSWHTGRHVTIWDGQESTRLFFSEPPNYDIAALHTTPVRRAELRARMSALADETRLGIIELLAQQDELSAQEIIAALDLSQSSISRHLKQLVSLGYLYERRGEGANKTYRLSSFYFERTAQALQQLMRGEFTQDEHQNQALAVSYTPALRRFVDKDGRLTMWPPAKQGDKLLILEYLTGFFEPGRVYSETEVNAVLLSHSTFKDTAALRRALYEFRFMNRERDGSRYWLTGTEIAH